MAVASIQFHDGGHILGFWRHGFQCLDEFLSVHGKHFVPSFFEGEDAGRSVRSSRLLV